MKFSDRIAASYKIKAEDGPSTSTNDSGAAHPENWVTTLQTGKSSEEIRQEATEFANIVRAWQEGVLQASDIFKTLEANGGRYLEMFSPIILKGMSKRKLQAISDICARLARSASIQ